jgi:enoyl-CoA hydratase
VTVATVSLRRPERRNAIDIETCARLTSELRGAVDAGARAVVLAGEGPHFCAGADLDAVHDSNFALALHQLLETIVEAPIPVIAAVHGAALGAGTQLAVACDLRVVDPTARFGIPAAKLGLMVDHWTVQRLVQLAGHGPARAMLLAAEEVDAEAALRLGLAQRAGGLPEAQAWASEIATLAPLTIAGHKLALNRLSGDPGPDAEVDAAHRRAWSSEDLAEGMAAFRERRKPTFQGR